MSLENYPKHEFSPRNLTVQEIANPYEIINALFDFAHLPQIRELLREVFNVMITGTWSNLSGSERSDLIYFYERIEKLVEASHLIHIQNPHA